MILVANITGMKSERERNGASERNRANEQANRNETMVNEKGAKGVEYKQQCCGSHSIVDL